MVPRMAPVDNKGSATVVYASSSSMPLSQETLQWRICGQHVGLLLVPLDAV